MGYRVKEIFHSLQGEGMHVGRAAVFCRFSGCNLWTGREQDRPDASCRFCDTDFTGTDGPGGGVFEDAQALAFAILAAFPYPLDGSGWRPYVVFTGGEPALQLTSELLDVLHEHGCQCGVETNGTLPLPAGLDWVTVSPKAGTRLAVTRGDELKLVWPQQGVDPADFAGLDFGHFILQPRDDAGRGATGETGADGEMGANHVATCVRYCLEHPRWRLGLQVHKFLGIR
ncbi:7-carboxy-7-deazaguanine synthase [Nitratidesulfovibrio liaohensis]|uniref:7-carboxy-7-deazaguanine synthase n=1 Tax=Nitratidesulfovibrio liaohensis TaxID=2604158 RepID=UPI0014241B95|nr:7-carboxy-7-deazaguanine synthase [Nitratidesulfovibrio liaohensis]NHZ48080.1 7-carboxy-7-deazaguanine synthase [Nitratidesulfovibrio liaohensis]